MNFKFYGPLHCLQLQEYLYNFIDFVNKCIIQILDTEYMKEEFVSRLMKEKEELLKLRKKKEFQREKIVELR